MKKKNKIPKLLAYTDMKVVDICIFRDQLIVACENGVFRLDKDTFVALKFTEPMKMNVTKKIKVKI